MLGRVRTGKFQGEREIESGSLSSKVTFSADEKARMSSNEDGALTAYPIDDQAVSQRLEEMASMDSCRAKNMD